MVAFEEQGTAETVAEPAVERPESDAGESSGTSDQGTTPVEEIEPLAFIPLDEDVVAPADIESEVEFIRRRAARRPVEGQIKTPDDIVRELEDLKYLAGLNTLVLRKAAVTRKANRKRALKAKALAAKRANGKDAKTRELQIEVIAAAQIDALEDAEIAYDYAKSVAQLVYENKSSVQTQAKQVELSYQLAGTGRSA